MARSSVQQDPAIADQVELMQDGVESLMALSIA
jgi:hypothetical protein